MNDLDTVRTTFTCTHCGFTNELTVAHVHEATVIHCSRCSAAVAPLRLLLKKLEPQVAAELARA